MISIFTIPKPFREDIGVIQRNALRSWRASLPDAEIIVCGDEEGAREAACEVGARTVDVERNRFGTPLLGPTFSAVDAIARRGLLAYVNADIVLLPDFAAAMRRIEAPEFLLVARRWNVDIAEAIDFDRPEWSEDVRRRVRDRGELYREDAIDCFVFPRRSALVDLPPFAVGRPGWDNYFIFRARQLRFPVIDATPSVMLVHQNHGYGHVPASTGDRWEGPEARHNRELMGGSERFFDIRDATHVLDHSGLRRPPPSIGRLIRTLETAHVRAPWLAPVGRVGFALRGVPPVARRVAARLKGTR